MSTTLATIDSHWGEILSTIPESLIDRRDFPRLVFALEGIANGLSWSDVALKGLSKPEWVKLKRMSKEFCALAKEAEAVADEARQLEREEAAHQRATVGETIPVFSIKGEQVGEYKKASDKLMELLLKSSNPAKYREAKAGESGGGRVVLQVSFGIPSRVPITLEGEIVDDDRSRTLKSPDEDAGHHAGPAPTGSETAGADAERDPDGRQIQGGCAGTPGNGDGGGNNSGGREGDRLCGHPGKKDPEDKAEDGPGAPAPAPVPAKV